MTVVYEFEGNLVRKVQRQVTEIGRVSDMLPTLMTYHPVEMGALPKNAVYLKVVPSLRNAAQVEARVIVQQPPQVREILFNESGGAPETQQAYRLSMPYFNFWFNMTGSQQGAAPNQSFIWAPRSWGLFWTRRPFENVDSMAAAAKMPNSWGDTRVCFGNNPITANVTMGAHIDMLINTYWSSVFNTDLDVYTPYGGRVRTQFDRWVTATESNSDAWMNWDFWPSEERPIRTLIEGVAGIDAFTTPAPDSTEPLVPQVPIQRTWYAINRWVDDQLTPEQRTRLQSVLNERGA